MLDQKKFFEALNKNGVCFFTGVPDSYLNGFCTYALENFPKGNVIAANEGNAVAIAAGHYFATKSLPLVYMQNSGLGNAVNPLASLVDADVYSVPMLLLIGWRGQPGTGDWPQHKRQGEITEGMLDLLGIPHTVLEDDDEKAKEAVDAAVSFACTHKTPYALIAPKGVLAGDKGNNKDDKYPLSREQAIELVLDTLPKDTVYLATTGRATRELFFLRERRGEGKENDFLNVGSMGHASSVALGIALAREGRRVVCFDGDSAAIMHLGALTMQSKLCCPNFLHIVLNNGAHESVGGQPSAGQLIDFTAIAAACGYKTATGPVTDGEGLVNALKALEGADRAAFLDVRIHKGLSGKLPPLDFSHAEAIQNFIDGLNGTGRR